MWKNPFSFFRSDRVILRRFSRERFFLEGGLDLGGTAVVGGV